MMIAAPLFRPCALHPKSLGSRKSATHTVPSHATLSASPSTPSPSHPLPLPVVASQRTPSPSTAPPTSKSFIAHSVPPMGGSASTGIKSVSVEEAKELLAAGRTYLDVRTPQEFASGHAPSSVNIPFMLRTPNGMAPNAEFAEQVKAQFPLDSSILVACASGMRSARASTVMQQMGYTDAVDMLGGFGAWQTRGYPSVTN